MSPLQRRLTQFWPQPFGAGHFWGIAALARVSIVRLLRTLAALHCPKTVAAAGTPLMSTDPRQTGAALLLASLAHPPGGSAQRLRTLPPLLERICEDA